MIDPPERNSVFADLLELYLFQKENGFSSQLILMISQKVRERVIARSAATKQSHKINRLEVIGLLCFARNDLFLELRIFRLFTRPSKMTDSNTLNNIL
jgi:hypothetical protein